jgi:Holliday junction resolvase RusA-like endonuclease
MVLLETALVFEQKIPSLNSMYKWGRGGKVYKVKEACVFQELIMRQLKEKCPDIDVKDVPRFKLTLDFVLANGIGRRDYDNMIKATQDAIFKFLGVDDNRIYHGEQRKWDRSNGEKEFIRVILESSELDITQFQ